MIINQVYFWTSHQSFIQRALGAASLEEAQKGLLYTGILKLLIPLVIVLPGIIGYYYFGDSLYHDQDSIYPELVKKVLPVWLTGFFVAVVMGAILSTFNSALNSSATLFSLGIYKKYMNENVTDSGIVTIGRWVSFILAVFAISVAPFVANAPSGLYQLLQQLNGIFMVPIATVIIAALFLPRISTVAAKFGLFFGFGFYILTYFILELNIHFVHIWGMEFGINLILMHIISIYYPRTKEFSIVDVGAIPTVPWKHTRWLSVVLITVTILIYILFNIA